MHRLVTIKVSHFNEKARWALDRFGVAYEEDAYMPGMHAIGVLKLALRHGIGKSELHSTPLATPVLLTDEGRCIRGSSAIVRYVSERFAPAGEDLYPTPEVEALEARFTDGLGPDARRIAYVHAFEDDSVLAELAAANVGSMQAWSFNRAYPIIKRFIGARLGVTPERGARSLERVRNEMAATGEILGDKRYLTGDRFTAADLAFACMASLVLMPSPEEGYGAVLPPLDRCPSKLRALIDEMRDTKAGRFAMRLFREERRRR